MHHARIVAGDRAQLLDHGDRRDRPASRQVDGVSRVLGKGGQAALFRRIGGDKQRSDGIDRSPLVARGY
jgi:hypothetical protein